MTLSMVLGPDPKVSWGGKKSPTTEVQVWAHVRWRSKSKACPFLLSGLTMPGLKSIESLETGVGLTWREVCRCVERIAWGREGVCVSILGLSRVCFLTWAQTQAPITLTLNWYLYR